MVFFNFAKNILVLETLWRRGALEDAPYIVYGCIMLGCAVYIYVCDATIFKASYKLMQFVHWRLKEEKVVLPTTKVGGSNSWERKFLWVSEIAEIANYTLVYTWVNLRDVELASWVYHDLIPDCGRNIFVVVLVCTTIFRAIYLISNCMILWSSKSNYMLQLYLSSMKIKCQSISKIGW